MKEEQNTPLDPTFRLRAQLSVLNDIVRDYPGRTIENVIDNIGQRIKAIEEHERRKNGLSRA